MWRRSLAVLAALSLAVNAQTVPAYSFAAPREFLGLEGAFTGNVGHVIFMPGFHACGTLLVLSAEGLTFDDLALLPNDDEQSVAARFASAANSEQEQDAREDQIVTWAKGWRKTCGKGESNKEVRVAKVSVDALKKSKDAETRAAAMNELDMAVRVHLDGLPPAPHEHMVVLTSLSGNALMQLFDLASTAPSKPEPGSSIEWPKRKREHGLLSRMLASLIDMLIILFLAGGAVVGVRKGLDWWRARQDKRIQLRDELDLEAE